MKNIPIPQTNKNNYWEGTTGVGCPCGGIIEWAEAGYTTGIRACRYCLCMFSVKGLGEERQLVPQVVSDGNDIRDIEPGDDPNDIYRVPEDLYPGWYQSLKDQTQE